MQWRPGASVSSGPRLLRLLGPASSPAQLKLDSGHDYVVIDGRDQAAVLQTNGEQPWPEAC